MQRRSFLQSSTSMAALALPAIGFASSSVAQSALSPAVSISVLCSDENGCFGPGTGIAEARGPVNIRVAQIDAQPEASVRFRLWFAGDEGQNAFELASSSPRGGRSSSLRLNAEAERLLAIDAEVSATGDTASAGSAQCLLSQGGFGRLKPGSHLIVLHNQGNTVMNESDPAIIAAIRLDIQAA
ncbi:MAG: hypothetical protein IPK97_02575 [Ahniella sp.]|nr:hypothetical protein [Ahniella sp.]